MVKGNDVNIELVLMGVALYILIWEKLPEWGDWFNRLIAALPSPLRSLYEQWHCPYCVGFWMALALHGLTGIWTLPALGELPSYLGHSALPLGWFLDALVTATLIYTVVIGLRALGLPAMKAHLMKDKFMKSAFGGDESVAQPNAQE